MKQRNVSLQDLHQQAQCFSTWVREHEMGFVREEILSFKTMVDELLSIEDFRTRLDFIVGQIRGWLRGIWGQRKVAQENKVWRKRKNPRQVVLDNFPVYLKEFLDTCEGFDPRITIYNDPEHPKSPEELQKDILDQLMYLFRTSETVVELDPEEE